MSAHFHSTVILMCASVVDFAIATAAPALTFRPISTATFSGLGAGMFPIFVATVRATTLARSIPCSSVSSARSMAASHRLPAGTLVFPAIVLVQTSSDAFLDPEEFRPERFLDSSAPPYTFVPFGGGTRRCIGAAFAVMEMKTVLSTVLQRVELRAPDERPEQPRSHHVTQIPARGARVIAKQRTGGPGGDGGSRRGSPMEEQCPRS